VTTTFAVSRFASTRTRADAVGCVASVVGASALVILLFLPDVPVTGLRFYIVFFIDPVARIIGYWVLYNRLRDVAPIWAELGFYPLVLGSLFHVAETALKVSASLCSSILSYSANGGFDFGLKLLVAVTLPFGLAIYACLIATHPPLRRWLGLMMAPQVVLLMITFGSLGLGHIGGFSASRVLIFYTAILMFAKALWFLSPVARPKMAFALRASLSRANGAR
jgi:hypothetical protein